MCSPALRRRGRHAGDGRLLGWNDAGQWYFVKADHLGSTRLVTSTAGLAGAVAYSAFGEVLGEDFPARPAARSRYGFCGGWGYENDALAEPGDILAGLGLLHVGARYYSPALPLSGIDPLGLWTLAQLNGALMGYYVNIAANWHFYVDAIYLGLTIGEILSNLDYGDLFLDNKHGNAGVWKDGVYVAFQEEPDGSVKLIHCHNQPKSPRPPRWTPGPRPPWRR